MTKGILGKKVGMTQIFTESGEFIPVTVIEAPSWSKRFLIPKTCICHENTLRLMLII